eukprot:scaffold6913_cov188-Prasinococcus_capsulatus_cf.AAC.1
MPVYVPGSSRSSADGKATLRAARGAAPACLPARARALTALAAAAAAHSRARERPQAHVYGRARAAHAF